MTRLVLADALTRHLAATTDLAPTHVEQSPLTRLGIMLLLGLGVAILALWAALKATMAVVLQVAQPMFAIAKVLVLAVVVAVAVGMTVFSHGNGNATTPPPTPTVSSDSLAEH